MEYYNEDTEELDLSSIHELKDMLGDPRPYEEGFIWENRFEEIGKKENWGDATICVYLTADEIEMFRDGEVDSLRECDFELEITILSDYSRTEFGTLDSILDIIKEDDKRFGIGASL